MEIIVRFAAYGGQISSCDQRETDNSGRVLHQIPEYFADSARHVARRSFQLNRTEETRLHHYANDLRRSLWLKTNKMMITAGAAVNFQ